MQTPNRCFQTKKILENSNKKKFFACRQWIYHFPTYHCALHFSRSKLHKEITCAMLAHGKQTTFMRKVTYALLYRPCWDSIA